MNTIGSLYFSRMVFTKNEENEFSAVPSFYLLSFILINFRNLYILMSMFCIMYIILYII